jgi:hypothetical protein
VEFPVPEDNGDPLTYYDVEFMQHDGVYLASSECDDTLTPIAGNKMQCKISFAQLRQAPYLLGFD